MTDSSYSSARAPRRSERTAGRRFLFPGIKNSPDPYRPPLRMPALPSGTLSPQLAFVIAVCLWFVVFVLDDTWFLLNVLTQSIGYHFQWLLQLGWWCDAFHSLRAGFCAGGAGVAATAFAGVRLDDAKTCAGINGVLDPRTNVTAAGFHWVPSVGAAPDARAADPMWMSWWTIFYWGWWIAWSPFVGTFLARISRNRTVREVINYTLCAPLLYAFLWFAVFGGAGIKMHRAAIAQEAQAEGLGLDLSVAGARHGPDCFRSTAVWVNGTLVMAAIGTGTSVGPLQVRRGGHSAGLGVSFRSPFYFFQVTLTPPTHTQGPLGHRVQSVKRQPPSANGQPPGVLPYPPPPLYKPRPCPSYSRRRDRNNCVHNLIRYAM